MKPDAANDELDFRQLLLDLLSEYQLLDKPANPELLKLHIDAATDKLAAYVAQAERKARLTELKMLQDLYKNELKFTHRDETELRSYTQYRISELERQSDEG